MIWTSRILLIPQILHHCLAFNFKPKAVGFFVKKFNANNYWPWIFKYKKAILNPIRINEIAKYFLTDFVKLND
jgi:hypothetical protein